jgi:DNA polymerase I-like protein with 3'-5' exonuclease and polymerase domains
MTTESYYVIDLETTVNSLCKDKIKCGVASPHFMYNRIVATGILSSKILDRGYPKLFYKDGNVYNMGCINNNDTEKDIGRWLKEVSESKIIVGHNIAFDMLYILNNREGDNHIELLRQAIINEPILVWDTMIVEHILSGQQWKYPSLDDVAKHYNLPVKPPKVKELWDAGVKTEDIDKDLLLEYLHHDVIVTNGIFKQQMKLVEKNKQRNIVYDELRARMSTIMMEYNGTPFNEGLAKVFLVEITTEINDLRDKIIDNLKSINYNVHFSTELRETINLSSPQQVSKMIFGGDIDWIEKVVDKDENGKVITYKSGIKKGLTKWKKITNSTKLITLRTPKRNWETSKPNIYSTSDDIINELVVKGGSWYTQDLLKGIQEHRKLTKERDTYLTGLLKVCWDGGLLHPTFNHVETPTGRLSCRNPNIQNITSKR